MDQRSPSLNAARPSALLGVFARFAAVGATGVAVNMLALLLLHGIAGLPLVPAAAAAVELAIIHNFIWNHRWTFGRRDLTLSPFLRFNMVSLGGLIIATGVLWALATQGGLHYLAANIAGVIAATCWNFLVNVYWTWGRPG